MHFNASYFIDRLFFLSRVVNDLEMKVWWSVHLKLIWAKYGSVSWLLCVLPFVSVGLSVCWFVCLSVWLAGSFVLSSFHSGDGFSSYYTYNVIQSIRMRQSFCSLCLELENGKMTNMFTLFSFYLWALGNLDDAWNPAQVIILILFAVVGIRKVSSQLSINCRIKLCC